MGSYYHPCYQVELGIVDVHFCTATSSPTLKYNEQTPVCLILQACIPSQTLHLLEFESCNKKYIHFF